MPTTSEYQPGKAWFITGLLAVFMLINFIDKVGIGLVAVPMMNELKLTPTQFGVIGGSFFWLFAISGVAGGFVANHVNTKRMILALVLVWSVALLPMVLASSLAMIVLSRVLLGIGEGPAAPVAYHAVYKWFPDHKRNLAISVMNQGSALGLLVAGISIPLITAHWGWRANFIAMAAVGMGWALLWLTFGAEGKIKTAPLKAVDTPGDGAERFIPYRVLMADATVLGIIVMRFVAYWGLALTFTWVPAYLQNGLGFDAVRSGQLFALLVIVSIPISLGLSWWSQYLLMHGRTARTSRAVLGGLALFAAGVLFMSLTLVPMNGLAKLAVLGVASGLTPVIYSLCSAMIGSVTPDRQRGAMLAIENSIASIAGVMAPVVMGQLLEQPSAGVAAGYESGFFLSGMLLIAGSLVGLVWVNPERTVTRLWVRR